MHYKLYAKFEELFEKLKISGRVLEIGAYPNSKSLLASKYLKDCDKVGLDLRPPSGFKDYQILQGNSNNMDMFEEDFFDCVMAYGVLEHDPFFWKTLAEIRRVLRKGGLMVMGAPCYKNHKFHFMKYIGSRESRLQNFFRNTTVCLRVHNYPGDYYRFSEQALKKVVFDGFNIIETHTLLIPPRIIACGYLK